MTYEPRTPTDVATPSAEGKGMAVPQPAASVPDDYVTEEYLVGGTATRFDAVGTPDDGRWTVKPGKAADYRTRVIVRRPTSPAAFSGTVIVEWFNVSAIEAGPDWGYLSDEITRNGDAYVGVSAQAQPIEGGDTLLDVQVDPGDAADAGVNVDKSGLRHDDPERYGTLTHPGDAYSYDIFNQVGMLARNPNGAVLGGLEPERVIAVGESQSSMFLTTLVNAIHPLGPVFDGFLIHSRGATVTAVDGTYQSATEAAASGNVKGVLVRTDGDVPVLIFETETDLNVLGYAHARQDDTETVRTWEVAGTSHADAQTLRAVIGGPRDPNIGAILGCGRINTGPHKEVLQAALHHLIDWAAGGPPPPHSPRIDATVNTSDGTVTIGRDEHGIARGGIRNPLTDVPLAALSGDPDPNGPDGKPAADLCSLFGSTKPFDQQTLADLYGNADGYLEQFRAAAAEQITAGFLLQPDADELIAEAETKRSLFP